MGKKRKGEKRKGRKRKGKRKRQRKQTGVVPAAAGRAAAPPRAVVEPRVPLAELPGLEGVGGEVADLQAGEFPQEVPERHPGGQGKVPIPACPHSSGGKWPPKGIFSPFLGHGMVKGRGLVWFGLVPPLSLLTRTPRPPFSPSAAASAPAPPRSIQRSCDNQQHQPRERPPLPPPAPFN